MDFEYLTTELRFTSPRYMETLGGKFRPKSAHDRGIVYCLFYSEFVLGPFEFRDFVSCIEFFFIMSFLILYRVLSVGRILGPHVNVNAVPRYTIVHSHWDTQRMLSFYKPKP